jgi:hypothetical protein
MNETLYTPEQRDQFAALLDAYPDEVAGLRAALVGGKIDGGTYWDDSVGRDCGCILGTIAHLRDECEDEILFYSLTFAPIEYLVQDISFGDTPATNAVSALLVAWIDEHQPVVDSEGSE